MKSKFSEIANGKKTFYITFSLFLIFLVLVALSVVSSSFAEWYSRNISAHFRFFLSFVTGFFTFSLAEILLIAIIPLFVFSVIYITVLKIKGKIYLLHVLKRVLVVLLLLFFVFFNTFGVCYFRKPLEENLNIDRKPLTREQLYTSFVSVKESLERSVESITFASGGSSQNPHDWKETSHIIMRGFDSLSKEYPFINKVCALPKKIILSPFMTYTHISGIYMPITGEANVNTNYPDYVVAFTMAHEMAHQRGIAGEDEANFIAFLALIYADDAYLEYCAYMNMYDYFLQSSYEYDKDMYVYFIENSHQKVLSEMYSYHMFFKKYSGSKASVVANSVNDTYLKTLGKSEGVESYGKVVELYSAYLCK